jgi:hypothetical protein
MFQQASSHLQGVTFLVILCLRNPWRWQLACWNICRGSQIHFAHSSNIVRLLVDNIQIKLLPVHATEGVCGSGDTAPCFLKSDSNWRWLPCFMARSLYACGKSVTHSEKKVGLTWEGWSHKSRALCQISNEDSSLVRPTVSRCTNSYVFPIMLAVNLWSRLCEHSTLYYCAGGLKHLLHSCEIWGSHSGVIEHSYVLDYSTMSDGRYLLVFPSIIASISSGPRVQKQRLRY